MKYVGIQEQINSNNRKSFFLLLGFPILVLTAVFAVIFFLSYSDENSQNFQNSIEIFIPMVPIILIIVGVWFLIAYFFNASMINRTAGSQSLSRKDNMRVYNLTENLCMSVGMKMPMLRIIESDGLNAFASGINEKTYTITLTRGIINSLNDQELEGVIAHELMHIRNKDVRLLIVSIIFVGIFSFFVQVAFRSFLYGGRRRRKNDGKAMIVILIVAAVAYLLSILFKFALSRKREYLADTGAAQMTKNPDALASALRKISNNYKIDEVKSDDVKQMFIENKSSSFLSSIGGLFATHPPIEKRIEILEQF